jgi:hypothetical protein
MHRDKNANSGIMKKEHKTPLNDVDNGKPKGNKNSKTKRQ